MDPKPWIENGVINRDKIQEVFDAELDQISCGYCQMIHIHPKITPCNHRFCRPCIEQWLTSNNTCPVDRRPLKVEDLKDISTDYKLDAIKNIRVKCRNPECIVWLKITELEDHLKRCKAPMARIGAVPEINELNMEVIENLDEIENGNKDIKLINVAMNVQDNAVVFREGLKIKLIQIKDDEQRRDIELLRCPRKPTMVLFLDKVCKFGIQFDNKDNKGSVKFTVKINNKSQTYVVRAGRTSLLTTLNDPDRHFLFVHSQSDDGQQLIDLKAKQDGIKFDKAEKIMSTIEVCNIDMEKVEKKKKEGRATRPSGCNYRSFDSGVICLDEGGHGQTFSPFNDHFIVGKRYRGFRLSVAMKTTKTLI